MNGAHSERERERKKNQSIVCTSASQCVVFIPAPAEHSEVQAISPVTFPDSITHSWGSKKKKKESRRNRVTFELRAPACRGRETLPSGFQVTFALQSKLTGIGFRDDVTDVDRTVLVVET